MTVTLEALTFETIIGILEEERTTPQRVIVDATFEYSYRDTEHFLNYAQIAQTVETTMQEQQFFLIEEALLTLISQLKNDFPLIESGKIKISKPDILPNTTVSVEEKFSYL